MLAFCFVGTNTIVGYIPLQSDHKLQILLPLVLLADNTCNTTQCGTLLYSVACVTFNAKQKHLGCKKGEANQKQQLSDYRCIRT